MVQVRALSKANLFIKGFFYQVRGIVVVIAPLSPKKVVALNSSAILALPPPLLQFLSTLFPLLLFLVH